jgi:hypothetical protein
LVTLVTGLEVPSDLVEVVEQHLQSAVVDLEVVAGGQPYWPVIIGVE